jgi:hypothetical protein
MYKRQQTEQTGGLLGQLGLADWWFSTFPEQSRKYIDKVYRSATNSPLGLTQGQRKATKQSPAVFLVNLAGRFLGSQHDRRYAFLMLKKAESLAERADDTLTLHKVYAVTERMYAESRHHDPSAEASLERTCEKHIELSPKTARLIKNLRPDEPLPRHTGYELLVTLHEKRGRFEEAVALCKQAMEQGWSGCYEQHVDRCASKEGQTGEDASPKPASSSGSAALCFDCALRLAEQHSSITEGAPEIPELVQGICPECKGRHALDAADIDG